MRRCRRPARCRGPRWTGTFPPPPPEWTPPGGGRCWTSVGPPCDDGSRAEEALMDLGLEGAHAVVTGGSKGMGRAIAERLAAEGAEVAVLARGHEAIDETVAALRASGSELANGLSVDATDPGQVEGAFAELGRRWGWCNVLVNTLGPGAGRFKNLDDSAWDAS